MEIRGKRLSEPFTPTWVHHSLVVVVLWRGEGEGLGWGRGKREGKEAVGRRDAKLPIQRTQMSKSRCGLTDEQITEYKINLLHYGAQSLKQRGTLRIFTSS